MRGGATGCAPFGESSFALGCAVVSGGERVHLDVTVQTEPEVRVIRERIALGDGGPVLEAALVGDRVVLQADWVEPSGATEHLRFR